MAQKPKTYGQIRPNIAIEASYRRRLTALCQAMSVDVSKQVLRLYKTDAPEIAQDASPAMQLRDLIAELRRKWVRRFDIAAKELASYYAKQNLIRSDAALSNILKRGGFSVKFQMTRTMNDVMQATIGENVSLISSLPQQHMLEVEGAVMRSVTAGRKLSELTEELQKRQGITRRRAELIARDQNNKMTSAMTRARQLALGITKGIWRHSRASHQPRPSHLEFDGHEFDLKEGVYLDGKITWPGVEINCRCGWSPILPGIT